MHDVHCVCICAGDVYSVTIEQKVGGLTPCWTGCNGWRPLTKKRGAGWGTVAWGAAALWLIRRLIFQWSSKSVSAYCAMLCSLLCPVIAVILSFDTPPFCSLRTSVFRMLWFVNLLPLLSRPAFFAIVFMNSLILFSPTGCSEYHSAVEVFSGVSNTVDHMCEILLDAYTFAIPTISRNICHLLMEIRTA